MCGGVEVDTGTGGILYSKVVFVREIKSGIEEMCIYTFYFIYLKK